MTANDFPAILIINGVPYVFPRAMITGETYAISSEIQLPTAPDFPPIITPGFRTANITIKIPQGEWKNKAAFKIAKQVIRTTQFLFAQRNNYLNENNQIVSDEKNATGANGSKLTIPFTNMQVPWELQISCAYFGITTQVACCIVSSFSVSQNPQDSTDEIWTIGLTEYDVSNFSQNKLTDPKTVNSPGEFLDPI